MEKIKEIATTLRGVTPILFDRYAGDNKTQLSFMEKIYAEQGFLVLPCLNIMSFLSSQNTESATQRVVGRGYKEVCKAALSYVTVNGFNIPFLRDGKQIAATEENLELHKAVARIKKGQLSVPNPKQRPMLRTPWELSFSLSMLETPSLREELLKKIFEQGGHAVGLGTFRGVFGKFNITKWEVVN
jgi:hypothetical protein